MNSFDTPFLLRFAVSDQTPSLPGQYDSERQLTMVCENGVATPLIVTSLAPETFTITRADAGED
jgi:hypothetical protein